MMMATVDVPEPLIVAVREKSGACDADEAAERALWLYAAMENPEELLGGEGWE